MSADNSLQNINQKTVISTADTFRPPRDPGAYLTAEDRVALARLKDAVTLRNAAAATMNKAEQALTAAVAEMRRLGFEGDHLDALSFSGRVFRDLEMPAEIKKAVTFRMEG